MGGRFELAGRADQRDLRGSSRELDDWYVDPGGACAGQQGGNQVGGEEKKRCKVESLKFKVKSESLSARYA